MSVKEVTKQTGPAVSNVAWVRARVVVVELLPGWYTNENSVRNAAQQGRCFRWKRDGRVLLYSRKSVLQYRRRLIRQGRYTPPEAAEAAS